MASPRVLKLADQIKVIVAQMLERRVKDPRLGFVTITDVQLTGDTREATVFYTVLGIDGDVDIAGTQAALASATGLIRSQVGRQLGLRHTPSLQFVLDAIPETAQHIEELLARAREGDAAVAAQAAAAHYAGDADPYRTSGEDDTDEAPDAGELDAGELDEDEPGDDGPGDDGPGDDGPGDDGPGDDEPGDDEPGDDSGTTP